MGAAINIPELFLELQDLIVFGLNLQQMLLFFLSKLVSEFVEVCDQLGILVQPSHNLLLTSLHRPLITQPNLIQTLLKMHEMPVHLLSCILIGLFSHILLGATYVLLVDLDDSRVPFFGIEVIHQPIDVLSQLLVDHCFLLEFGLDFGELTPSILSVFFRALEFLDASIVLFHGL